MEAVNEQDLFKHLVLREGKDKKERDDVLKNLSLFKSKISTNIFMNEYYVLYEALISAHKYNATLNYDQLYQIIINNIDKIINSDSIVPDEFTDNVTDTMEVKETLAELCMTTFEDLKVLEREDEGSFKMNVDLFLNSWGNDELQKIIAVQHEIAGSGKNIGREFKQGFEDADQYYKDSFTKVKQMIRSEIDEEKNIIRTDRMTFSEIKDKFTEESVGRGVTSFGIDSIDDDMNDLRVGDLVSVMGQPGAGKTRMAANIMYNGLMRGSNVLWYPLEGSALQAFSLLVSRHIFSTQGEYIDLTDKTIYDQSYEEKYEEIVDVAIQDLLGNPAYGKLSIKNIPLFEDEVFDSLEAEYDDGFLFDILCIDYVSLIMSKNNEPANIYLSRLVKELKSKSMSFRNKGFLTLLPHQLTKEVIQSLIRGEDTTITGSADTSEIIKSSDMAVTLFRTEEQSVMGMINIFFTKARFSKPKPTLEVAALHEYSFFADLPDQEGGY